ncbi:MAG: hypothetical protein ACO1Q7_18435 [Gemmatimonas sp.]
MVVSAVSGACALLFADAASAQSASARRTQTGPTVVAASLSSLDAWIVQRYRGAQLLPDSGLRGTSPLRQAGAPRVESMRSPERRDTIVALQFGAVYWRASLTPSSAVQLADPTGVISAIGGRVAARRAFRAPRVAAPRDTVSDDWRIGWAYLVAIPPRVATAAPSGFNGWAIVETPSRSVSRMPTKIAPLDTPRTTAPVTPPASPPIAPPDALGVSGAATGSNPSATTGAATGTSTTTPPGALPHMR